MATVVRPWLWARFAFIASSLTIGATTCTSAGSTSDVDLETAIDARVDELVEAMTLEEKVAQKAGLSILSAEGLWTTPGLERLGIQRMAMVDGPRGVSSETGANTAFPVPMARGATFDPELERQVGAAIGTEAKARGAHVLLGPCINMLRHPRWGRAQETYGEDVHLLSRMGVAFVHGAQRDAGIMASAKHFVGNSIEDTRFDVDVVMDPRTLREVYLPAFRAAVREGEVASIMTAYNGVNGAPMSEQAALLSILKDEWGFEGFVESDWVWGTESTVAAARAGLDIEMPVAKFFGDALVQAVEAGEVSPESIDASVRRILRARVAWGLVDDGPVPPWVPADLEDIERPDHLALARTVALRSMVLLRNEAAILPLDGGTDREIVMVGALADTANVGDDGSSAAQGAHVVTPLEGLVAAVTGANVSHVAKDDVLDAQGASDVAGADVAVVVVGNTAADEGEYIPVFNLEGDRDSMALSAAHEQLIADTVAANPNTVVVLEGGSAILVDPWHETVPAIVMAWYPGGEGGHALAELLLGRADFSGHLPLSIPVAESDLVPFDNESLEVQYDYFHGYRALDRDGVAPRYAFGHGLSYAGFEYSALRVVDDADPEMLSFELEVRNTAEASAADVVQLYVGYPDAVVTRNARELRAFERVELSGGMTKTVTLHVKREDLAYWDETASSWRAPTGALQVEVGHSAVDLPLALTVALD